MTTRIILSPLLLTFLIQLGCYSEVATKTPSKEDFKGTIAVTMKDGQQYEFTEGQYSIQGDTLTGFGRIFNNGNNMEWVPQWSIAISQISEMRMEKFSKTETIVAIVASAAVAGFLIYQLQDIHIRVDIVHFHK